MNGPMVVTASGGVIPLSAPIPPDILISDIAQGLSNVRRWVGQTNVPISVAEHSLNVEAHAPQVATAQQRLQALLHDAPEAYLGDVSWPIKQLLPEYQRIERLWLEAIMQAFGLPKQLPEWLAGVDMAMAVAEAQQLLPAATHAYIGGVADEYGYQTAITETTVPIHGWGQRRAYRTFVARFNQLMEDL